MGGSTIVFALSVALLMGSCDQARADEWTGRDKRLHALGGAMVAGSTAQLTGSRWQGFLAGSAVAIGKEIADMHMPGHTPSVKDAVVTLAGAALAVSSPGLNIGPGWISYRMEF